MFFHEGQLLFDKLGQGLGLPMFIVLEDVDNQ
jgi:hypothetical protein